jgi:hypothetical protein
VRWLPVGNILFDFTLDSGKLLFIRNLDLLQVKCQKCATGCKGLDKNLERWASITASATFGHSHHPTTALVGISWHCKEPCKFMSSILTISVTITHCIPITYKHIFISMTYKNSKKIK